ncbi:hypothetical protein NDA14_003948 [Ustilago hordei]|nr:hypothetical protein NDA14_003948 [Ustilago hordei]
MDGKECCKYLQEQIREAQHRSVDQYNRKHKDIELKVGDMVYINHRNWKTRRPTPKLDTWFAGPYPVQEWVGHQAYRITLPANLRVHDVFHVSMLEPARTSSLPQHAEQPTIPSLPDEDLDFEVEALIDKHAHNGTTEYKVLWRGYSEEAASWEPCHGPGCSRSRRVTGSYGRSTGIEDLVDTSRAHGRSAVSMETMDSYGLTCKGEPSHMRGGPGTATRRTKLKEQAQPRRGPSSDGYHSGARETRVIGHWQAGPEEEEQCRRSRHQVMRRRSSVKGVDTTQEAQGCQAGEAPEQYSMKKVLSGERAGAASLAKL